MKINWATLGSALLLAACGGGDGTHVASTPPAPVAPPLTPAPTPTPGVIIPGVSASQDFAGKGGNVGLQTGGTRPLDTSDANQLKVRYDGAARQYQVQVPGTSEWLPLIRQNGTNGYENGNVQVSLEPGGYQFSALARWYDGLTWGGLAFGVPTRAGGVPGAGSATYGGQLAGYSTEMIYDAWGPYPAWIGGSISLAFDFGAGTLAGSLSPNHSVYETYALPTLNFTDTVYSRGSTTFSGRFATELTGANSFSGLFTGPNGQEVVGNFAFPYISPLDGKKYDAGGGFVGKKP